MKLFIVDEVTGAKFEAGLYDVCEWIYLNYPEDIFKKDSKHPVHVMRNNAKKVLKIGGKLK